ncbi:unnamed protein product [Cylicocyclus nassatus]|uniref:Potassium channel tetramerisation-type BTB domain-containing protein n=1 Tax=Cylicocyclus nassatus TaxID=53992 RepID=A0AA36DR95_CYLNA|nr:unnamed protein product [Cylicocyclus nassatus]
MVANRWRNQEELFIDRSPTHFAKVLDYLRDGASFALPKDDDARQALRKEAEFYNIPDLAKMCCYEFKVLDKVQWKDNNVIEAYWKFLVRHLFNPSDKKTCMACMCTVNGYVGPTTTASYSMGRSVSPSDYDNWVLLKHHTRTMKGIVAQVFEQCCRVKYSSALELHLPKSALRLSR